VWLTSEQQLQSSLSWTQFYSKIEVVAEAYIMTHVGLLIKPRTKERRRVPHSFRVAAPTIWDDLQKHLRCVY